MKDQSNEAVLPEKTVKETNAEDIRPFDVMIIDSDWRTPYLDYLQSGKTPEDKEEKQRLEVRARSYLILEGELYRRGVNILMKCVSISDGIQLLEDVHKGICGNLASSKTLIGKVFRQGFYWPIATDDAHRVVKNCQGCQFFCKTASYPSS